jgi:hypothetical protein
MEVVTKGALGKFGKARGRDQKLRTKIWGKGMSPFPQSRNN